MKEILSTRNYKSFKKLAGNREVEEKRIDKIVKSIQKVGYITSPIIVNEKLEVIDGQGRLQALERLHLPVEYIIEDGIGINECISMNIYQTNWKMTDYIESYATRGNENYQRLLKLHKDYPLFSVHSLATALYGIGKLSTNIVNRGDLILSQERYEIAKERLDYALKFVPYLENFTQKKDCLLQGIMFAKMVEEVDEERLLQRFISDGRLLKPYHTINECMQSLEEMYNRGLHNPVYIFTQYRIQARENLKHNIIAQKESETDLTKIESASDLKRALEKIKNSEEE